MSKKVETLLEYQSAQLPLLLESATLDYAVLNLAGEVGELLSILAKAKLKEQPLNDMLSDPDTRKRLRGECGDVLFLLTLVATRLGFFMDDIANENLEKLHKRKAENKIIGDGDFR